MLKPNSNIAKTNHADPEARMYNGKYYIYATKSRPFKQQQNIDLYISEDGEHWREKKNIIDMSTFPYTEKCVWAPSIVEKNGLYYLVFAINNVSTDNHNGGLEIAVSSSPEGPFVNHIGTHLVSEYINGAQPIDAHFFKDDDGKIYLFYGGCGHCNVAIMNDDMNGFVPLPSGELIKEFTPQGYHEAPCMFKRNGIYYFMWSTGNWENSTYKVLYGMGSNPLETVEPIDEILGNDENVARAPGHNGYIEDADGQYYVFYHRRPLDKKMMHCRILAIDKMNFDDDGRIQKIQMTL